MNALAAALRGRAEALAARAQAVLAEAVGSPRGPWALLDFPSYPNVGDSAIWVGTRTVLRRLGWPEPAYACDNRTFDADDLERRTGDGPVLLLGGGNLGDRYRKHERLREEAVTRLRGHRIVQLPQTVRFDDPSALERARRALSAHPSLTVLVRDDPSLATAREGLGVEARLCPDLAFCLDPGPPPRAKPRGVLWLCRDDALSLHRDAVVALGARARDWARERPNARRLALRWLSSLLRRGRGRRLPLRDWLTGLQDPLAAWRMRRGMRWLRAAEVVVTDRLHGHIFALLAGVPHVLLDDASGKVRAFHEAWTRGTPGVAWAEDAAEAARLAEGLRAHAGTTAA